VLIRSEIDTRYELRYKMQIIWPRWVFIRIQEHGREQRRCRRLGMCGMVGEMWTAKRARTRENIDFDRLFPPLVRWKHTTSGKRLLNANVLRRTVVYFLTNITLGETNFFISFDPEVKLC
jgi:hypothetical protein